MNVEHTPSQLVELLNSLEDDFRLSVCPSPCNFALDVGCGTGKFVKVMNDRGIRAVGVDINSGLLHLSDSNTVALGDAHFLPFADGTFDFVSCHSVYHELDQDLSLNEMKRVLKPGGTLNIIDVAMVVNQNESLDRRLLRIRQQVLRRLRFAAHFGPGAAYALTQYLQSTEWKEHRKTDRVTTLEHFRDLSDVYFVGAQVGLTGNGVLTYLNWKKI